MTNELDNHIANLKSNKAFWKGKSEEGKPIEKVYIPKFNVSVLRVRASHRMSSKASSITAGRKSPSSATAAASPANVERPSIIQRMIRRFSVSSRMGPPGEDANRVPEEKDSAVEENSDEVSVQLKASQSLDDISVTSKPSRDGMTKESSKDLEVEETQNDMLNKNSSSSNTGHESLPAKPSEGAEIPLYHGSSSKSSLVIGSSSHQAEVRFNGLNSIPFTSTPNQSMAKSQTSVVDDSESS